MSAPVDSLPVPGLLPLQPPDALQLVAFAVDQDNIDVAPVLTEVGNAESVKVGIAPPAVGTFTVVTPEAVAPLAFVHVRMYELVAASGPTV